MFYYFTINKMQFKNQVFYLNFVCVLQIFFTCATTGFPQNAEIPPSEFPTDNSSYKIIRINSTTTEKEPPIEFPTNSSTYKIIHSSRVLQSLNTTNITSKIDAEVPDLLAHVTHEESKSSQPVTISTSSVTEDASSTTVKDLQMDAVLIEDDITKTEDVKLMNRTSSRSDIHREHGHLSRAIAPPVQGQLAAILAGVFAMIAVLAYIGLLTWRKYLEHRYGNRDLLINEDDYINYNDMKNFEL